MFVRSCLLSSIADYRSWSHKIRLLAPIPCAWYRSHRETAFAPSAPSGEVKVPLLLCRSCLFCRWSRQSRYVTIHEAMTRDDFLWKTSYFRHGAIKMCGENHVLKIIFFVARTCVQSWFMRCPKSGMYTIMYLYMYEPSVFFPPERNLWRTPDFCWREFPAENVLQP